MFIRRIMLQYRRDFWAIYKCEWCDYEHGSDGYDDTHFHNVVVPDMACPQCGRKAWKGYKPKTPRYPDGVQL